MRRFLKALWRDQRGYTLIELIASSAIFIIISIAAIAVFISVSQSSTKTGAQRKVQQDVRVNIEEMTRTIRSSRIDYAFYNKNPNDIRCGISSGRAVALFYTRPGSNNKPVTRRVIFLYKPDPDGAGPQQGALWRYEAGEETSAPSCSDVSDDVNLVRLTANNVGLTNARFFISPNQNPYATACTVPPLSGAACQLIKNTHPRVTILLTVRTGTTPTSSGTQIKFSETTLQTTVGSRAYPVLNIPGQPS